VALLSAVAVVNWLTGPPVEDWRGATSFVLDRSRPTDGIVLYNFRTRQAFEYYYQRSGSPARAPDPVYPASEWGVGPLGGRGVARLDRSFVQRTAGEHQRLWLVLAGVAKPLPQDTVLDRFEQRFTLVEQRRFDGRIKVRLYERTR
jgi:hypothetical protein